MSTDGTPVPPTRHEVIAAFEDVGGRRRLTVPGGPNCHLRRLGLAKLFNPCFDVCDTLLEFNVKLFQFVPAVVKFFLVPRRECYLSVRSLIFRRDQQRAQIITQLYREFLQTGFDITLVSAFFQCFPFTVQRVDPMLNGVARKVSGLFI